ncbi:MULTISPECIES: lipocalin family protein [Chryseobacterium]|uniref:lipocalin family protein n=1 Tax=Chryseobacterium sp. R2A-55 TaxID=2744445 RepID=UPI001F4454C3|nr:lipocalin family protein [Chryseobacterium sp. R2A-55]
MEKMLLGLFLMATIASCNSDRGNDAVIEPTVIGVWKLEKDLVVSGADHSTILHEYIPDDCKNKSTFEFAADGKYVANTYNTINSNCVNSVMNSQYQYKKNEKKLIIGASTADVLELSDHKLVVYAADNYDSNNDGINDFVKYFFIR